MENIDKVLCYATISICLEIIGAHTVPFRYNAVSFIQIPNTKDTP